MDDFEVRTEPELIADAVILSETAKPACVPQFNELSIFHATGDVVDAIVAPLLEAYSGSQAYVICKKWGEAFKEAGEIIRPKAINGTNEKNQEIEFDGKIVATMNEKSLPRKWEYEDATLDTLNAQIESLTAQKKEREKLLQTIKVEVADATTGELMKPAKQLLTGSTIAVNWK